MSNDPRDPERQRQEAVQAEAFVQSRRTHANPTDLDSEIDAVMLKHLGDTGWNGSVKSLAYVAAKAQLQAIIAKECGRARIEGMEQAKSRVLRRTEIPKDAKNPTRDYVVILGEDIAKIIDFDLAALKAEAAQKGEDRE